MNLSDYDKGRRDEREEIWQEINRHIKTGKLPGDGFDETAQRNGLILASNIIAERRK